jgi:hypothetical protein
MLEKGMGVLAKKVLLDQPARRPMGDILYKWHQGEEAYA